MPQMYIESPQRKQRSILLVWVTVLVLLSGILTPTFPIGAKQSPQNTTAQEYSWSDSFDNTTKISGSYNVTVADGNVSLAEVFDPLSWEKQGLAFDLSPSPAEDYWLNNGQSVIKDDGIYKMWYAGMAADSRYRLFHATSVDGKTWSKQGKVMDLGTPGGTEDYHLGAPYVLKEAGIYKMWYGGYDGANWRIHYAESSDGIIWSRQGVTVPLGSSGELDDYHTHSCSVMRMVDGTYKMWYGGYESVSTARIMLATSPGGISWAKQGVAVDLGAPGERDENCAATPNVLKIDDLYYMFYTGSSGAYGSEIQYATSSDGVIWAKHGLSLPQSAAGTDDSAVINPSALIDTDGFAKIWYSGATSPENRYRIHWARTPYMATEGNLTSEEIALPNGYAWTSLNLSKTEPGTDNFINVSILNGSTGIPITGYTDMTSADIDISGINPTTYPSIKLLANFSGNGSATPILHEWGVKWTWDGVTDLEAPKIYDLTSSTPTTGDTITISAMVTDDIDVQEVHINYRFFTITGMSSLQNETMNDIGGGTYNYLVSIPSSSLILNYTLSAKDTSNHWNVTDLITINVTDDDSPQLTETTIPTPSTGDEFTITATVTDNIAADDVCLRYYFNTTTGLTTSQNVSMTFLGGGNYNHTLSMPASALTLYYNISANDISNNWNETGLIAVAVYDNDCPIADTEDDITINEDVPVTFNASGSTDNIGIVNYTWNFTYNATNHSLYGMIANFTFFTPGNYSITLTIKDAAGNSDTDNQWVNVTDTTNPIADASSNIQVSASTLVIFNGSGSTDNLAVTNYTWTFTHNGTVVTLYGISPQFRFWTPGTYTVTLMVTDATGNWNTDSMTVSVSQISGDGAGEYWWIILLILIVVGVVVAYLLRRKPLEEDHQTAGLESSAPASMPLPAQIEEGAPSKIDSDNEGVDKLSLLEDRYREGKISRETYEMLKSRYSK